ncbi:MAG: hypothetical protein ABSG40_09905, partial [Terriglobales bacterium]
SWLHSVVIGLSPFVGLTTTRYSCYATKRQPFYFFVEKLGLKRIVNEFPDPERAKIQAPQTE